MSPWTRASYRVRQFVRGLRAHVTSTELADARLLLPAPAYDLFARQPVDAQRHSLNVLGTLRAAGPVAPDLAAATLLHDVGKIAAEDGGAPIGLWLRGPLVLFDAAAPAWAARAARPAPAAGWRYLLYVHREHAAIGATWAAQTGCSPATCWLIAHHQDKDAHGTPEQIEALRRLQWADNQN